MDVAGPVAQVLTHLRRSSSAFSPLLIPPDLGRHGTELTDSTDRMEREREEGRKGGEESRPLKKRSVWPQGAGAGGGHLPGVEEGN